MRKWFGILAVAALALAGSIAHAQDIVAAKVVTACGTPGSTPVVGNSYPITQDTTLTLCTVSGGGGGGGNVTVVGPLGTGTTASGVRVTLSTTDAAALQSIITNTGAAIPAGTNLIGKVGIDQTTPGTTNGVQINAALPAGTNVIGHVITDTTSTTAATQATAANLNATVVGTGTFATQSAITAASGSIASGAIASGAYASGSIASGAYASGSIADGAMVTVGAKADAATCATTNTLIACTRQLHADLIAALPAGANLIGKVGIDQTTPGTTNAVAATLQTQTDTVMVGGTNIKEINAVTPLMGNGVTGTGSLRVTLASDTTANSNPFLVQSVPGTANGLTSFVLEPAASDNHTVIKNGAATVYSIQVFNNSATVNYIRLYNLGTGFNGCGSATALLWEGNIPASTSGAGFVTSIEQGIAFSTGISICVTSGYGQTNTTSATATAISVNVGYK